MALGGGRKFFYPNTARDPEYRRQYGSREDNQNLVEMWKKKQLDLNRNNSQYIYKKSEFDAIVPESTDSLLGEMKTKECLDKSLKRFFLFLLLFFLAP